MKLSQAQKDALLTGLHLLAKDGPSDTHFGICHNLDQLVVQGLEYLDVYSFVSQTSVTWPGLTGMVWTSEDGYLSSCAYPIRNTRRAALWEGDQLTQRMSLIEYLTAYLQA